MICNVQCAMLREWIGLALPYSFVWKEKSMKKKLCHAFRGYRIFDYHLHFSSNQHDAVILSRTSISLMEPKKGIM